MVYSISGLQVMTHHSHYYCYNIKVFYDLHSWCTLIPVQSYMNTHAWTLMHLRLTIASMNVPPSYISRAEWSFGSFGDTLVLVNTKPLLFTEYIYQRLEVNKGHRTSVVVYSSNTSLSLNKITLFIKVLHIFEPEVYI